MGKTKFNTIRQCRRRAALGIGFLLGMLALYACAPQKRQPSASQYRFEYDTESYRIRSIFSSDKMESHNELVGENFVAADFDQDRVIDSILLGSVSLSEAQKIYAYGLDLVAKENKLRTGIPSGDRYVHESNGFVIEIVSFRPANAQPCNQFKIIPKGQALPPSAIIMLDQNADGVLDEVLQGAECLESAQSQYAEMIEAGLQKGALIKVDNKILVREK
jgi:hypothetical protein